MSETTVKARILRVIEELPNDATYEDAMERIYILQNIELGMKQIEAGEGIPHEEVKREMKRWHE